LSFFKRKKLLQYNNNISMPKDFLGEKCLNLWRFIRHSLHKVKMRKEGFEDGEVWKKSQVEVLFKDSVVNCSNREWLRDVHAADYIKHVAEMEAITLYIMEQRDVGYCEAAESMGFACMTQCWVKVARARSI